MSAARPHDVRGHRGMSYCRHCWCYRPEGQGWDDDCVAAPGQPDPEPLPPFGESPSPVAEAFDRALGETEFDRLDRLSRRR